MATTRPPRARPPARDNGDGPDGADGAATGATWVRPLPASLRRPVQRGRVRGRLRQTVSTWRVRASAVTNETAPVGRVLRVAVTGPDRRIRRLFLLWRGAEHKVRPLVWAAALLSTLLAFIIVGAALDLLHVWILPFGADQACEHRDFACGVGGGALVTVFAAAVAFTWLILVRLHQVVNWGYARDARTRSAAIIPTAADVAQVVGRDDLCRVIERDLRDRSTRRPQVIVGGVGAGKTAVLLRLMQWLAERGAVPVAVRLRDMSDDESFRDLAARRFRAVNDHRFKSEAEADRIWRRLCWDGLVVVLADGLEEAMIGSEARETSIRQALDDARMAGLPLVVASRPDDALLTLDAALIELGPVDETQAFEYVRDSRHRDVPPAMDDGTLQALMSAANVAEMPLYLQLTREFYVRDLLRESDLVDLDEDHRLDIRIRLLENWRRCVCDGRLAPDPSITPERRVAVIDGLSALAAAALATDSLELRFKGFESQPLVPQDAAEPLGPRVAANLGARLGVVETLRAGVRFRHSIMQAFLGSLWIREHGLMSPEYIEGGLSSGGREFLMALVMACARVGDPPAAQDSDNTPEAQSPAQGTSASVTGGPASVASRRDLLRGIRDRLAAKATGEERPRRGAPDEWRLLLLSAAYEIERMIGEPASDILRGRREPAWPDGVPSPRIEAAKRQAVDRIAELKAQEAYRALYDLSVHERSYRVRLASAQHLAMGGDVAVDALRDKLEQVVTDVREAKRRGFTGIGDEDARRFCLEGWILPLLVANTTRERAWTSDLLESWLDVCEGAPPDLDTCIAQGFKYEANRVPQPGTDRSARIELVHHAESLLDRSAYWYTRMTLLHAMTLWMLPESARPSRDRQRRLARWAGDDPHPFVRAAAVLCGNALTTRNPSLYMWIDETGIVAKLGQRAVSLGEARPSSLWLTESLGWVALDPAALRLVADVLLLLTLTDGPHEPNPRMVEFKRTVQACSPVLPPCITGERTCLCAHDGEDERAWALPGTTCAGGCEVRLCPYPLPGRTLRPEFSESVCRRLATLRGRSEWHEIGTRELQRFWRDMERRVRST